MTAFALSVAAVDLLWRRLELGPQPLVIRVPPPAHTATERAGQTEAAETELAAAGLMLRGGVHPELVALLRMLARPERELDARLFLELPVRALAASAGEQAALVVSDGTRWQVTVLEPTGLAHAILSPLPERPAGPGESVSVRSAALSAAAASGDVESFEPALIEFGVPSAQAAALALMFRDPVDFGQFGVAGLDPTGRRRRAERVVAFHDTSYGRYLVEEHRASDGTAWTTVSPADTRRLHGQLTTLSADLCLARSPAVAASSPVLPHIR
ncbi:MULTISPECIES: ESX secretion-associated protein EspG [unclassified Crossiella]|uniref:ESX secretion-associated protein EspG n=1 Tax=unclassified Crossiella TaxID=2620835 RepID=UPI001FFF4045|nr:MULTISPECIES: ESX secretion-associated protein EspG [unclassified Crossiella]MCK2244027.1 ESX secretion-associated protein EspG [Crossiella sp. S99.2]MCK2257115.1 ESX secretion-associated protein EspG [Crossiella sp. S99.1]